MIGRRSSGVGLGDAVAVGPGDVDADGGPVGNALGVTVGDGTED